MTHLNPTHPTKTMIDPTDQLNQVPSLADLFAESDRVGDKYLTDDEIETRNQEINETNAAIDKSFPDL